MAELGIFRCLSWASKNLLKATLLSWLLTIGIQAPAFKHTCLPVSQPIPTSVLSNWRWWWFWKCCLWPHPVHISEEAHWGCPTPLDPPTCFPLQFSEQGNKRGLDLRGPKSEKNQVYDWPQVNYKWFLSSFIAVPSCQPLSGIFHF